MMRVLNLVVPLSFLCGMCLAGTSRASGKRKGSAKDRATKPSIVITELPYQTNKADFVAAIADLVEEQKLTGAAALHAWLASCPHELRGGSTIPRDMWHNARWHCSSHVTWRVTASACPVSWAGKGMAPQAALRLHQMLTWHSWGAAHAILPAYQYRVCG